MKMTRCMLKYKKISKGFWGEAITTATYILNRCPTKALVDKTPFKAIYGCKPKIHDFIVFGSIAYPLILAQHRTNIDDKIVKCIFVRYSLESKGFRLCDPITRKVIITKDASFAENESMQLVNVDLPPYDDVHLNINQFDDVNEMGSP